MDAYRRGERSGLGRFRSLDARAIGSPRRVTEIVVEERLRLIHIDLRLPLKAQTGCPVEPARKRDRGAGDAKCRIVFLDLRAAGILIAMAAQIHGERPNLLAVSNVGAYRRKLLLRIERRLLQHRGVGGEVDVRAEPARRRKFLRVIPRHGGVAGSAGLGEMVCRNSARDEPVQPAVPELSVDARETGIRQRSARAAAPVVPRLGIHVVAQIRVIADILDVAAVRGAVSDEFTEPETRRQDAAPPAVAYILK